MARCPAWRTEEHEGTAPALHSTPPAVLPLMRYNGSGRYVDVRVAQYMKPLDEQSGKRQAVIEVAHHASGHCRRSNLTPENAQKLVAALLDLADAVSPAESVSP